MDGRMSAAGFRAVNAFERPMTAPTMKTRELEVKPGHVALSGMGGSRLTPPKRNPATAMAGRSRRAPAPRRGQVKAAIAQSVLQTLTSIVQGARTVALRRSFSWTS